MALPQLADFLAPRIERAGGLMPLPDVYCLFNRARGAELISPDDLLAAAQLLGGCAGGRLSFRRFASGVLVVQSAAHSDEQVTTAHACMRTPMIRGQARMHARSDEQVAPRMHAFLRFSPSNLLTCLNSLISFDRNPEHVGHCVCEPPKGTLPGHYLGLCYCILLGFG